MKKSLLSLLLLAALAACAKPEPPFNAVNTFNTAEESMRRQDFEKARKAYQEIQEKSPERSYDAVLQLRIADTYFGEEKYEEALVEYQNFLNYHPVSRDAAYAQFQIAMCSFRELTTIDRDPEPTRIALREFRKLLQKYPGSPYEENASRYISICLDRLAEYELYVGRFYYRKKAYRAAIGRFEGLLKDYPGSSAEKEALYLNGLAHLELGEKAPARTAFEALINKYPSMTEKVAPLMVKLSS